MTREKLLEFAAWIEANEARFLGKRVAVVADEAESMSKGGIIIPQDSQTRPKRGRVVAFGLQAKNPGADGTPSDVADLEIGDTVLHNIYNTLELAIPDRDGNPVKVSLFGVNDIYIAWPKGLTVEVT